MDIKKEFIEYLVKGKVIKASALKNPAAIEVLGNIIKNPVNYAREGGSFQIILSEYENWYELYCPMRDCITDGQLMNMRLLNKITDEEYQYGLAFLAYLRVVITNK